MAPTSAPAPPIPSVSPSPAPRYGPTASLSTSARSSRSFANAQKEKEQLPHHAAGPNGAPIIGGMIIDEDDLDDNLHTFGKDEKKDLRTPFNFKSSRGWANGLTLFILMAGFVVLFAGYPIIDWAQNDSKSMGLNTDGYNIGGLNGSGQVPNIPGFPRLIDADTPSSAYTRTGSDGKSWDLVFSDEFEKEGRTFYPGDDPFFTAVDIHYWPTVDLEWYDPAQVTTKDGHLLLTLEQRPLNNLNFRSGMLQSWNQLCFNKNAYFEVSLSLPGTPRVGGLWPGIWTMGNLGRPGYGASTEGTWPYSYSSCDVGILPNQTRKDGTPAKALTGGDPDNDIGGGPISYLPGQKLSACNCPDSGFHPGPKGVGRGAVEIDMLEAQTDVGRIVGGVSQSAQVAPFDYQYTWNNGSTGAILYGNKTKFNNYRGGVYQEAVSAISETCRDCDNEPDEFYYLGSSSNKFATYGFEYVANINKRDEGYIEWYTLGEPSWRLNAAGMGADPEVEISERLVAEEPMTLIFNLGLSNSFETVDLANLDFPAYMRIDYIRVYQLPGSDASVGCDPEDRPTAEYIAKYPEVYSNPNLTTWGAAGYEFPGNEMNGGC